MLENFKLSDFGLLRVATSSPNLRVADVEYNFNQVIENINVLSNENVSIIVFPELFLSAHSCGDLFYQKLLLDKCLHSLIELKKYSLKFGNSLTFIIGLPIATRGKLFNCAAVISNGKISGIVVKSYLCNTGEYYEERWFSSDKDREANCVVIDKEEVPFGADLIFSLSEFDIKFGIEICEDLWAVVPPSSYLAVRGADIIFNLSASIDYLSKSKYRRELVKTQSARLLAAYLYCSSGASESTTDFVYSGHCLVCENGKILSESDRFNLETENLISDIDIELIKNQRQKNNTFGIAKSVVDFREIEISFSDNIVSNIMRDIRKSPFVPTTKYQFNENCNEIFTIQKIALARRLSHINCKNVVIGVSGGLDSTLALLVAVNTFMYLGLDLSGIHCISMPGFGTTGRTKTNALNLCELIGVTTREISIVEAVNQHFEDIEHNPTNYDITYENAQARERTQILMDIANQVNGIVIGTGDMSELALGWCTYNADQMSMYNVNAGVPKTLVKHLLLWYSESEENQEIKGILKDISITPISPELLPLDVMGNQLQVTEDSLGPYELHDFFLYNMIRNNYSPKKIFLFAKTVFKNYDHNFILDCLSRYYYRFFTSQFKRSAMPDGVKVGSISLSPRGDWRMPSDASFQLWLKEVKEMKEYFSKY
jgi:NAD+ synthase (glutamine-hydrolysing)